jgi:hypothetical protein
MLLAASRLLDVKGDFLKANATKPVHVPGLLRAPFGMGTFLREVTAGELCHV